MSESAAPETIASPSSTPGSATLQQNSSSNCNRLNQSFTGTSSSDVGQPCGTKQLLELSTQQQQQQPASQHQQPHQSQMQASIQDSLQQDQLPPTQQLLQQAEQNQHLQHQNQQLSQNQQLQQLQQSQQLGHLGQQLQLGQHIQTTSHLLQGQHFHVGQQQQQQQQLQQTLQLQQGQQLLQSQQLQQLIQQQGQQLLHGQPSQVQQLLQQQQQVSQQQLMQQQHVEQQHHQSPQLFLQHQGQSVMQQQQQQQGQSILQPQGQSVMQQSTGQPQYQNSQRFLPSSTQHLMSQHGGGQQLLQQSQLMQQQPLQQQILQQTSQQQLVNHIQPAGQQLYQPGMFQQQSNQQLLQAQLLQSQPGQQLLQQQSFQLNQQQQQQTQQQLLQTQQLNSLQQQIVLQAIQAQGLGNLSGIAGRSLSLVPSGSSIGLVNTVPATVYRHLGSTVGTSSTTLTTQISKGNLVTGSRVALSGQSSSSSAQRPTTVQVVQQRQNAPLFIGQFGMVSNGTIIPSGIVPLGRPQAASGSVNVQASGGQPQILASPTQIQLAAPLLGSAGNILNQQTLQVAMAQIQPQQQSPGANLLTSQQPLYIQTGLSVADGNGTISSMTLPRFTTASGHTHPLGLSMSLPVQIPVGVAGLGQAVTAKPASWSVSANAVASSCSAFQMEAGQLKMNTVPGCSDLTHSLTIESIPLSSLAQSCAEIGGQNYAVSLGFDSQLSLAPQVHLVTGLLSAKSPLDTTDNRRNSMKPEDFTNSSMALGDCAAAPDQTTKDCELNNVAANPEKQTAKVMPQILTHIIEGFVIQEGPEPFPVQRSSFMREYLDSTDEMTDSSCEGQSADEADDKMKVAVNAVTPKEVQDAPPRQTHIAKEATKCCVHCAKEYEPPAFGKMGKFCSVSCAKRSAATSRWTMYHVNKQNEAASPGKQSTTRRRSSNVNGRGWIRTNESRNTVSAQLQRYSQMSMSGVSGGTQVSTAAPAAVAPRAVTAQMTAVHAPPRVAFDSSAVSAEHETGLSFQQQQQQQQRTPPAQVLTSPRQDWTEVMHRAAPPPAVSRDSLGEGSDPTLRPPSEWSVQDVYTFVKNLPGCSSYADEFRLQEIDGQALLLLKEDHFMTTLNLKLGPALKICQQIAALKDSFS